MASTPDSHAALWTAARAGDASAREALIVEHLKLVYFQAHALARRLPPGTTIEDMVSAGMVGLLHAVDRYDLSLNLAFSTFALPRIKGAMLDERRQADTLPRGARQRVRALEQAKAALGSTLGRTPSMTELAAHLEIDARDVMEAESDAHAAAAVSLDGPADETRATARFEPMAAESGEAIEAKITREQELAVMREVMVHLKEKERTVLALYYFEELKMHQIAEVLGVTEGRVSQLRTAALAKLRTAMAHLRADPTT